MTSLCQLDTLEKVFHYGTILDFIHFGCAGNLYQSGGVYGIKHKKTGFIYNLDDEEEFYNYVRYLILNPKIVYKMKLNAIEESKLYSEKIAWKIAYIEI